MKMKIGPWLDKRGRQVCSCGGYHFPHRKGGGACDHSATWQYHRARRVGDPDADLYLLAVSGDAACPF